jgi:hypothetical protein
VDIWRTKNNAAAWIEPLSVQYILDVATAGAEYGSFSFLTTQAGTNQPRFRIGAGVQVWGASGAPAGGDKGLGTFNTAGAIYQNNVSVSLAGHAHATSDITSGTFVDARIASSNVTQHQASISLTAAQLTGSMPDARIVSSNVTQHQSALTIAETQITDGAVLARVGGNEAVTGSWTFTARPKTTSAGGFLSYASSGNTGGSITVSTSAPSGTPADGDLWFVREA